MNFILDISLIVVYNYIMKWLLLYDKTGKSDSEKIGDYFKRNNIDFEPFEISDANITIDNDETLVNMMTSLIEKLKKVTHVICINISEIPLKGIYLYSLGLLSYANISVFYIGTKPVIPVVLRNSFFPSSVDIKDLFDTIETSFPEFIKNQKEIRAKKELNDRNILVNNDYFARAITDNDLEVVELLYNAGLDVNSTDNNGTPMLSLAVRNESFEMVKWLVEKNVNINTVSNDRGYTPLMDAVWKNKQNIVEYLIDNGAEVNTTCKDGQPIAVIASGVGNVDICRLLCENGSDIYVKDAMGMSAFDYASLFNNKKLLEVYNAGKE